MRIRLLGPVELRVGADGFASVAGAQRRAVLALLALRLGHLVTVDQLCELLWDEQPPASARAAVQGHVAALRKVLADTPFELCTRDSGYLLAGPADAVDALRFEELTAAAEERAASGARTAAVALLEEALRLWRGEALADLPDTPLRAAAVDRLERSRTAALLRWAGLRLGQGAGASAVPLLEQGVRADGLREELVALLMRCLHQAGRSAEALTAYHRARVRLDEELGIHPGPALRAALAEVLADDRATEPAAAAAPVPVPTPARVPRQLPRRHPDFVGRVTDLARLDRACGPGRAGDGPVLVVGPAGVGKSALVTAWAHRAAGRFPDGVLHAGLRGLDPDGPARPEDVLAGFLRALGVPEADVPAGRPARAALYRERTGGRRLLVLLDDAADAEQVADLLPEGPESTAVVISRCSLEGLVALDGAALLRLAALPEDDALQLLERALTPERLRAEPEAAARLAGLCDRLPLALRIAAARLADRPDWAIAELVAELADERTRLAVLDADGTLSATGSIHLTYRRLSDSAAGLLTALAAHPGREVDAPASAALLAGDTAAAHRAIGELASHHLLTATSPGRHARTDLVRLFGAERLAERPGEHRRLLRERLADYYLAALQHCGFYLDPGQEETGPPVHPPRALPAAADIRTALDWFDAEEPAISALVADPDTDPARAWRLALTCGSLYYGAGRFTDWLGSARLGLAAAERCGDPVAVALLLHCRAQALVALERRPEAAETTRRAVAAVESVAGPGAESVRVRALATLALVTAMLGNSAEATRLAARATSLALEYGNRRRLVDAKVHQGWVSLAVGDREGAQRHSREARELLPATPVTQVHLWSLLTEAQALPPTVRGDTADLAWHRLLAACEEAGLLYLHAITEQSYAAHLSAHGRGPEVAGRLRTALDRFRSVDRQAGYLSEFTIGLEEALDLRTGRRPTDD
ncbi:AfsR/SARP family transcriptional regulator [Kitasatospora brasiliensis]|uniref:AfsR/SARP family transcriptional regulator n=1 Tax=Kitasatospora brasiliensis TaxID=3058040 RepID=UPI00292DDE22|nr:BTAD domain-containing putative transcriptional regulator [Kitasatospora sp. K002]